MLTQLRPFLPIGADANWLAVLRRQSYVLSLRQGGAAQRVVRLMELCREAA